MSYQWNIYIASLDPVQGSEQAGLRPVLVVSREIVNKVLPVVNVIPITSLKAGRKVYPNEVVLPAKTGGLANKSLVMCHQIRTLDKGRLTKKLGQITNPNMKKKIRKALRFQLQI